MSMMSREPGGLVTSPGLHVARCGTLMTHLLHAPLLTPLPGLPHHWHNSVPSNQHDQRQTFSVDLTSSEVPFVATV